MNNKEKYWLIKFGRRPRPQQSASPVQTPHQKAFAEAKRLKAQSDATAANARHVQVHGISKADADLKTKNHNKELKKRQDKKVTDQQAHQRRGQQKIDTQNQADANKSLETYKTHHNL